MQPTLCPCLNAPLLGWSTTLGRSSVYPPSPGHSEMGHRLGGCSMVRVQHPQQPPAAPAPHSLHRPLSTHSSFGLPDHQRHQSAPYRVPCSLAPLLATAWPEPQALGIHQVQRAYRSEVRPGLCVLVAGPTRPTLLWANPGPQVSRTRWGPALGWEAATCNTQGVRHVEHAVLQDIVDAASMCESPAAHSRAPTGYCSRTLGVGPGGFALCCASCFVPISQRALSGTKTVFPDWLTEGSTPCRSAPSTGLRGAHITPSGDKRERSGDKRELTGKKRDMFGVPGPQTFSRRVGWRAGAVVIRTDHFQWVRAQKLTRKNVFAGATSHSNFYVCQGRLPGPMHDAAPSAPKRAAHEPITGPHRAPTHTSSG